MNSRENWCGAELAASSSRQAFLGRGASLPLDLRVAIADFAGVDELDCRISSEAWSPCRRRARGCEMRSVQGRRSQLVRSRSLIEVLERTDGAQVDRLGEHMVSAAPLAMSAR